MKTAIIATIGILSLLSVLYIASNDEYLFANDSRPTIKEYETCRNNKCKQSCPKDDAACGFSAYYYGNCVPVNKECLAYEEERMDITKADDPLPDTWYNCQTECGVENPEVTVDAYPMFQCYQECGEYEEFAP